MSNIPDFLYFIINMLATLLSTPPLLALMGIWIAAYVIYLFFRLMKGGFRK